MKMMMMMILKRWQEEKNKRRIRTSALRREMYKVGGRGGVQKGSLYVFLYLRALVQKATRSFLGFLLFSVCLDLKLLYNNVARISLPYCFTLV
jgi:DNA invertase Pin-like site-specific DNA recombinase